VEHIGTDIEKASKLLLEGKLVAIPTETVYGLAANALDEQAVLRIFEAKQRPFFDPLIVHVHSL
jgi:L-threonylcarbamoyladenylate synthase